MLQFLEISERADALLHRRCIYGILLQIPWSSTEELFSPTVTDESLSDTTHIEEEVGKLDEKQLWIGEGTEEQTNKSRCRSHRDHGS